MPLAVPFTALGMHPGMATTWLLPEATGLPVARELLLTGRTVTGEEAARLGLVVARCHGTCGRRGADIAAAIARNAPIATRLTKVALADGGHASCDAALHWEALASSPSPWRLRICTRACPPGASVVGLGLEGR